MSAAGGTWVARYYHRLGLTLSHYDARGHLVVARRIIDSLTPGWQQIGAVWLPLPHLLNALPVQVDAWYRSGASGVAISIASFALAVGALSWIVYTVTDSPAAATAAAAVFGLNPNVLYLQATPMTEPLLIGLMSLGVACQLDWLRSPEDEAERKARRTGWVFALACMTRYEAWPVMGAAVVMAWWAKWRDGESIDGAVRRILPLALRPALAIVAFLCFSRVVVGEWFVDSGFFVPENKALNAPAVAAEEIWFGVHQLSGYFIVTIAGIGVLVTLAIGLARRRSSWVLSTLALAATAALPWTAFLRGHPFRIRYMVPLIAVEAVCSAIAAGALPRFRWVAAVLLIGIAGYELRPLDLSAPMVIEAQWDRPNVPVRAQVTACLTDWKPGQKIMASMGSLGHYMQEASRSGFALRDFLHEGNGDIWLAALAAGPRPFAEWVLIEEKAEGGDMLAREARERPHFLDGFTRVCEGAGLALYRRR